MVRRARVNANFVKAKIDLERASRTGKNIPAATEAVENLNQLLDRVTDEGQKEIEYFHLYREKMFQSSVENLITKQIENSKTKIEKLNTAIEELENFM